MYMVGIYYYSIVPLIAHHVTTPAANLVVIAWERLYCGASSLDFGVGWCDGIYTGLDSWCSIVRT